MNEKARSLVDELVDYYTERLQLANTRSYREAIVNCAKTLGASKEDVDELNERLDTITQRS